MSTYEERLSTIDAEDRSIMAEAARIRTVEATLPDGPSAARTTLETENAALIRRYDANRARLVTLNNELQAAVAARDVGRPRYGIGLLGLAIGAGLYWQFSKNKHRRKRGK